MNNFNLNVSGEDMIKILSVMITVISTYFVAKYNSNTPRKLEIKQKQLEKVYLPIYKLIVSNIGYEISKQTALDYSNKIQAILWENYELAYPLLHVLNKKFLSDINFNNDYQKTFDKICYQVGIDYDLLKKSLGYPSENTFGIFKRMNVEDKFNEIVGWLNVFLIFDPILFIIFSKIPFVDKNFVKILVINYGSLLLLAYIDIHKKNSIINFLNKTNNINRRM